MAAIARLGYVNLKKKGWGGRQERKNRDKKRKNIIFLLP